MIRAVSDLQTLLLSRFNQDAELLAIVPASRQFEAMPRHAAEPWIAFDAIKVTDNGSSLSEGHRIEIGIIISARATRTADAWTIAERIEKACIGFSGPAASTHVVDLHCANQVVQPRREGESVRVALTLTAFTEPL